MKARSCACDSLSLRRFYARGGSKLKGADMAETCYSKGRKVILVPGRKDNGKWVCQFTIPEFKESEIGRYQDDRPEEYETEWEARAAAFKYAKRIIDSSSEA